MCTSLSSSACVCICLPPHNCVCAWLYFFISVGVSVCVCVCTDVCLCLDVCVCVCARGSVLLCVCLFVPDALRALICVLCVLEWLRCGLCAVKGIVLEIKCCSKGWRSGTAIAPWPQDNAGFFERHTEPLRGESLSCFSTLQKGEISSLSWSLPPSPSVLSISFLGFLWVSGEVVEGEKRRRRAVGGGEKKSGLRFLHADPIFNILKGAFHSEMISLSPEAFLFRMRRRALPSCMNM